MPVILKALEGDGTQFVQLMLQWWGLHAHAAIQNSNSWRNRYVDV